MFKYTLTVPLVVVTALLFAETVHAYFTGRYNAANLLGSFTAAGALGSLAAYRKDKRFG